MRLALSSLLFLLVTVAMAPSLSARAASLSEEALLSKLSSQQSSARAEAASEAAARGLRRAIPKIIALLEDDDADVRLAAARALSRLRTQAAITRLLVRAQIDPDVRVREAASRAVREIAPKSFASKLGSADPPPVRLPPPPALRPRAPYATHFTAGLALDVLRADESLAGRVGWALRWGDVETQLTMGFPAMSFALRARWLIIAYPRLTPYLVGGAEVAFNNADANALTAVSMLGGVGLRWYLIPPIFVQLEVVAAYALHAPRHRPKNGETSPRRRFAFPVTFEVGFELWP
ncbi:MAG: HEAT repeat domain-containing protein [Deltaproteobacteria bacterium]|nr:HEAT repeat domain-containing protein [Deltaproteobacteria bacterium]